MVNSNFDEDRRRRLSSRSEQKRTAAAARERSKSVDARGTQARASSRPRANSVSFAGVNTHINTNNNAERDDGYNNFYEYSGAGNANKNNNGAPEEFDIDNDGDEDYEDGYYDERGVWCWYDGYYDPRGTWHYYPEFEKATKQAHAGACASNREDDDESSNGDEDDGERSNTSTQTQPDSKGKVPKIPRYDGTKTKYLDWRAETEWWAARREQKKQKSKMDILECIWLEGINPTVRAASGTRLNELKTREELFKILDKKNLPGDQKPYYIRQSEKLYRRSRKGESVSEFFTRFWNFHKDAAAAGVKSSEDEDSLSTLFLERVLLDHTITNALNVPDPCDKDKLETLLQKRWWNYTGSDSKSGKGSWNRNKRGGRKYWKDWNSNKNNSSHDNGGSGGGANGDDFFYGNEQGGKKGKKGKGKKGKKGKGKEKRREDLSNVQCNSCGNYGHKAYMWQCPNH